MVGTQELCPPYGLSSPGSTAAAYSLLFAGTTASYGAVPCTRYPAAATAGLATLTASLP
jgi:hypothetical protein